MKTVSVREAKARLSALINDLEDEVVILRHGRPVAILKALSAEDAPRVSAAVAERLHAELVAAAKRPSITLEEYRAGQRSYERERRPAKRSRPGDGAAPVAKRGARR